MLRHNVWHSDYQSETCNIAGSHGCSKYVNKFKRQKLKDGKILYGLQINQNNKVDDA